MKTRIMIVKKDSISESAIAQYEFPFKPSIGETVECFDEDDISVKITIDKMYWKAPRNSEAILFIEGKPTQ